MATAEEVLRRAQIGNAPANGAPLVRPEKLPPGDEPPSETVRKLMDRARIPFAVVEYPRFDETGQPVCSVHIRVLTTQEETLALAAARKAVARLVAGTESYKERPDEIEANERIKHMLAVAVRDEKDPSKPFFRGGVVELEYATTPEELAVLGRVYANVRAKIHPQLSDMSEAECEAWLETITKGYLADPFSYPSREQLETYCAWASRSLASLREQASGTTSTVSSSSE